VVIENDDVHAALLEPGYGVNGGRAAIHSQQESGGEFFEAVFDGVLAKAVAFVHAMGQVEIDHQSERAQDFKKKGRRGNAVHVVIAEDNERFLFFLSTQQSFDGSGHIREEEWIRQLLQARVKKGGNGDRVAKAAVEETLDEERGEVEGAGQLAGEERVGG
jgi:hypothetical protein